VYSPEANWTGPLAASANTAPTIGEETLVPPRTIHPLRPTDGVLSYTQTPVLGSATAATSATVRRPHPASCCQSGFAMYTLQPLPEPLQTVSTALRSPVLVAWLSVVPPTAIVYPEAAGNSTPYPASPALTVTAMPGWL